MADDILADDIVTRLRDKTVIDWEGDEVTDPLCDEAADEIERLRAAGDALAVAVNDDHRLRFCETDCPSRAILEAWLEARYG